MDTGAAHQLTLAAHPRQLVPYAQPGHGLDLLKRKKGRTH